MLNTNRRILAVLGCLLACSALAACGSSSSSSSSSSGAAVASASSSGFAARRAKLVACLKQHGVTLPSRPGGFHPPGGSGAPPAGGVPGGGGFFGGGRGFFGTRLRSDPKLAAAFRACGAASFSRRRSGFNSAQRRQLINNFVRCVREHGYNLPKPNLSGAGPVFPQAIESNAKFRTASRACATLLIGRGTPPPSPSPSSST